MKKRRFKEKHRSPVSGMPKQVKREKHIVKREKKNKIFSKDKPFKKKVKRKNRNLSVKILGIVVVVIVLGLLVVSVRYLLSTRKGPEEETVESTVLGLEDIPAYPESTFLFEENKTTDTVQNFLMSGQSAYRLPSNTSRESVNEYYTEELPELGWSNVLSVAIGSEDMKYGEYWTNDKSGLRIYVKENSVWYETITIQEASNGLADEVKEEVERELLLASSETQDLLPDFPWVLKVPKEYVISYKSSELEDFRQASFKKIGSNHTYTLTPVGYFGGNTFDSYLYNYIDSKNTTDTKEWGVQNSYYIEKNGKEVLLGDIITPEGLTDGAVIKNSYNTVVYILISATKDDPFFEYILENIEAKENIKL